MSLQRFFLILRGRWRLVAGVLLGVMLLTLVANLLLPRKYVAEAAVVVDTRPADPVLGVVQPVTAASAVMSTQVDIILSERVAQHAVALLKLDQDPDLRGQWLDQTNGRGSLQAWLAAPMRHHLKVMPTHESNVVSIIYTAGDAATAAVVANAFAQAYIDTNLELKVASASQYSQWFGERTRSFRDKLEAAQQKLSAYQQSHRIVVADEKLDVETARLSELSTQLVEVQGHRAATRGRNSQAGSADILPEVVGNGLIQNLKARLADLDGQRQQLALRLRETHPEYLDMMTRVAALRAQIGTETSRIAGSLGAADRMNASREGEIRGALDTQKQKVLELRAQRDGVAVLQRDVEQAQRDYDMVTQRLVQTGLESQMPQTNVAMLTVASEPSSPASPKVALNTALSVVFGTLLGIGLALLLEHLNRRLRSGRDLSEVLAIPVLAVLPRKGRGPRLFAPIEAIGGEFARLRDNSSAAQAKRLTTRPV
ncbi:MAG: chain length determinant protein EpsF [Betaproteobacteria bacterium HGW-Betaproteobacteria-7]|jgi:chain length determinant protein EpsF|nr:MAG: chain length determinant protein EpsF [Betaproteobacteria bacterium HGW-Betaproteobacteria-7]